MQETGMKSYCTSWFVSSHPSFVYIPGMSFPTIINHLRLKIVDDNRKRETDREKLQVVVVLMAAKFSLTFIPDLSWVLLKLRAVLSALHRLEPLLLSSPRCQHQDGVQRKTGAKRGQQRAFHSLWGLNKPWALPVEPLIQNTWSTVVKEEALLTLAMTHRRANCLVPVFLHLVFAACFGLWNNLIICVWSSGQIID